MTTPAQVQPVLQSPQPAKPPVAPQVPLKSGRELLREAKPVIDYGENFGIDPEPAPVTPAPAAATPEPAAPVAPAAPNNTRELEDARIRQAIAEQEAARAKSELERLTRQAQTPAPAPEPEIDLVKLMAEDPLKAIEVISERTAKRVKAETLQEIGAQQQLSEIQDAHQSRVSQFQSNVNKVLAENADLANPDSALTKIYLSLDQEMPELLTVPDGPLKAIRIAKDRLALQSQQAPAPATPTPSAPSNGAPAPAPDNGAIREAEKRGQQAEAARQESVRAAQMVSGPSRVPPPTPSAQLTAEQKLAARKMRMSEEEYQKFLERSPKYFAKEPTAQRRRHV